MTTNINSSTTRPAPAKTVKEDQDLVAGNAAGRNGEDESEEPEVEINANNGSRISFAPGTTFHDRARLRSRGASKKVAATFNLRPVTSDDKVVAVSCCFLYRCC